MESKYIFINDLEDMVFKRSLIYLEVANTIGRKKIGSHLKYMKRDWVKSLATNFAWVIKDVITAVKNTLLGLKTKLASKFVFSKTAEQCRFHIFRTYKGWQFNGKFYKW